MTLKNRSTSVGRLVSPTVQSTPVEPFSCSNDKQLTRQRHILDDEVSPTAEALHDSRLSKIVSHWARLHCIGRLGAVITSLGLVVLLAYLFRPGDHYIWAKLNSDGISNAVISEF